jgi:hypothetical protein
MIFVLAGRRVVMLAPARLREYTSTWIVAIAIVSNARSRQCHLMNRRTQRGNKFPT